MGKLIVNTLLLFLISCTVKKKEVKEKRMNVIHNRPTPVLPVITSPRKEVNAFSINLSAQMHSSLFEVNYNNTTPLLIENFNVSSDQLEYTFHLKDMKFHNGMELKSSHVKRSLESVIKMRATGFERFNNVVGYEDFLSNAKKLQGISVVSDKTFIISLHKPTPDLLVTLSDLRNIILYDEEKPEIGIGPYKISNQNESELVLSSVDQKNQHVGTLRYYKTDKTQAISDFLKKNADDLFLFPIEKGDLQKIKDAHISTSNPPRTYLFALNSETISPEERSWLIKYLPSYNSLKKCYPDGVEACSIAPKGRLGYLEKSLKREYKIKKPNRKIHLSISRGVGNEECLKKALEDCFSESLDLLVTVDDGNSVVEKWKNNSYDISFFYLELDNSIDEYQFFTGESSFNWGLKNNDEFTKSVIAFYDETDLIKKAALARNLNQSILDFQTVKPLFYPKQHLIYSKKYNFVNFSDRQDTDMKVSKFQISESYL